MITIIKAVPPSFEEGYCPDNWRDFALKLMSETQFLFQSDVANSFYNYGDVVPTVDNRAFPWIRTIAGQMDRLYNWSPNYGAWIAPYWPPPTALFVFDWKGTEAELKVLDNPGGSANPITATTGPFWQVDHDFDQRIAIGAGTLPLATTVLNVGDTGGQDQITLIAANTARHRHSITLASDADVSSYLPDEAAEAGAFEATHESGLRFNSGAGTTVGRTREGGGDPANPTAGPTPIGIMPPYRVVLKVIRTARQYYAV